MLIKLKLEKPGEHILIGAPIPTTDLWAKVDGIISILPIESAPHKCELTLIGMPGILVAVEPMDDLAARVNECYGKIGALGSFMRLDSKPGGQGFDNSN